MRSVIKEMQDKDSFVSRLKTSVDQQTTNLPDPSTPDDGYIRENSEQFLIDNGVLYHCQRRYNKEERMTIVVPRTEMMKILRSVHEEGNHAGPRKMRDWLEHRYWWRYRYADVQDHYNGCLPCATANGQTRRHNTPIGHYDAVNAAGQRVHMDILKLDPITDRDHNYVMVGDIVHFTVTD